MKTIQCNLSKKHAGFSQLSQNHYISIWEYFLKNFKNFNRFIEELYARLCHSFVRSIEFVSILK